MSLSDVWAIVVGIFWKEILSGYAKKFAENFAPLEHTYPYLFSRNGEMIMWGRSMPYRIGSIIPFPLMGLEANADANFGWMRRIASGVMLQFLKDPNFLQDNVPTLGFYGPFEPAVQPYSCRGSAFWLGKAFLGLLVPADNPFWNATENEGAWTSELKKGTVRNLFADTANILVTDYPNIGASEIRAWCNVKAIGANEPFRASENYNRLSYNSAFPWQADSVEGVVAMNYIFKNKKGEWEPLRLYDFQKFADGIYYRNAVLETDAAVRLRLADCPLPNGILRVDKIGSPDSVWLRLGHYALPQRKRSIKRSTRKVKGHTVQLMDNGEYQLAMVPLQGWTKTWVADTENVHPQSRQSAVINVEDRSLPSQSEKLYATLMLWKKSGERWTENELLPVSKMKTAADGSITVIFANGTKKMVRYN